MDPISFEATAFVFLFFYAPGAHCPEDVRIKFYDSLTKAYMKIEKKNEKYILVDANARLGMFTNELNIHGIPLTNKNNTYIP